MVETADNTRDRHVTELSLSLPPVSAVSAAAAALSASAWHEQLGRVTIASSHSTSVDGRVRRFRDIDRRIVQPALAEHVLAVHLGGAKRVIRRQNGRKLEVDVAEGSYTIMPAHQAFDWETFGPIDFAHVAIGEDELADAVLNETDGDPAAAKLDPIVGARSGELGAVIRAALATPGAARTLLWWQTTRALLLWQLINARGTGDDGDDALVRGKLATWQLRRVVDYMHAHLAEDIELSALIGLTGLGRARFFYLFKASMGRSPHDYLRHLRLLRARELLIETGWPVREVAAAVGLEPTRLSAAFRSAHGLTPRAFRRAKRAG